jgi:hypothetical protein
LGAAAVVSSVAIQMGLQCDEVLRGTHLLSSGVGPAEDRAFQHCYPT